MATTRVEAEQSFDLFLATYGAKYPKTCECLGKDREELLTFYDFPAEHWKHLRTTNPIESVFATCAGAAVAPSQRQAVRMAYRGTTAQLPGLIQPRVLQSLNLGPLVSFFMFAAFLSRLRLRG